jgi:hypothetical protein
MAYFHTKKSPNPGTVAFEWKKLMYLMAISKILSSFGIFWGHLVYFGAMPPFGLFRGHLV